MARPDLLAAILPSLSRDTVAAIARDLSGLLTASDRPGPSLVKATGRALATVRCLRPDAAPDATPDAGVSS